MAAIWNAEIEKKYKHKYAELLERSDKPPFFKGRFGGNVKVK